MQLVLLCSLLLPSVLATAFSSTSAVITAQDFRGGLTADKINLAAGWQYRVYAVYASSAVKDNYASKIVIKGTDNTQTLATLAKPKDGTAYVLDPVIMTAPITITDTNPPPASGIPSFLPFTIYIVSTTVEVAPVLSAQLVNGPVYSNLASIRSSSCTVLSAEMTMMIGSVDMGSMDSIDVKDVGFDAAKTSGATVLTVTKSSTVGSFVMISGPIATLSNPSGAPVDFSFVVRRDGVWSGSLSSGARTTFLSNGFMTKDASYNVDYSNESVKWRTYSFDRETRISFSSSIGNYKPPGDTIDFTCIDGKGNKQVYDPSKGDVGNLWCKQIDFQVKTTQPVGGPRFMVQIESGALSTSMSLLLIVSIVGRLFQ